MQNIALFTLLGLGSGALVAAIAFIVVLSYRGAGVINLAAGAMAMISGYSFWSLKTMPEALPSWTSDMTASAVAFMSLLTIPRSTAGIS